MIMSYLSQYDDGLVALDVSDEAGVGVGLYEGEREGEREPAEQGEEQHGLPATPALGHVAPERHGDQLDERTKAHQHPRLGRVEPELLEIDTDQRKQRPVVYTHEALFTNNGRATNTTRKLCSESTNLRRSGGSGFQTLDSRIRSVIRIATKIVSLGH